MGMVEILFIAAVAGLWRLGGWDKAGWSGYRDVLVPVALGIWSAFTLQWWMLIAVGGPANSIRMGYGAWDPEHDDKPSWLAQLTHDRTGNLIRLIYGLVTAFAIGLFPALYTGHYWLFLLYVLGNGALEFCLNKYKAVDWVVELLNGAGRASMVLWLR